jgi:hypothetical protein
MPPSSCQLPLPRQAAMSAVLSPSLPASFDLRDPEAVMEAHALFGIKLHKEAAALFITKYLGDITPTQSSDCTTLLGCLSLYPCKRIVTLAPDATLSDSLMKRYGIALSSHTLGHHTCHHLSLRLHGSLPSARSTLPHGSSQVLLLVPSAWL